MPEFQSTRVTTSIYSLIRSSEEEFDLTLEGKEREEKMEEEKGRKEEEKGKALMNSIILELNISDNPTRGGALCCRRRSFCVNVDMNEIETVKEPRVRFIDKLDRHAANFRQLEFLIFGSKGKRNQERAQ